MPGTVALKSFLAIHACAHSSHVLSRHMGSLPGVVGSSGKHIHPFVPLRKTGGWSLSFAGQSRMVAFLAMAAGAALMAFWIFHSLLRVGGFFSSLFCDWALDARPRLRTSVTIIIMVFPGVIGDLLLVVRAKFKPLPEPSLDELVRSPQHRRRDGQAERLHGLEIDDQLEFGRLLDW